VENNDPKNYARRLVKGSTIVFTGLIAAGLVGFLLRMFLARNLSVADYGLFYAVFSLVSFFSLFRDLGLNSALVKYIPEFQVHRDFRSIKSAIISVTLFQAIFALLITALLFVFSDWFALEFFKSEAAVGPLQILSIWFFIMVFYSVFRSVFQGLQNMLIYSALEFSWITLVAVTAFLFISALGLGVVGLACAYLVATLVTIFLSLIFLKRSSSQVFSSSGRVNRFIVKELFTFAFPVLLGGLGGIILGNMDTIMLTAFRSLSEVGFYQAAQPTASVLGYFSAGLTTIFFPMVSELWAKGERKLLGEGLHFLIKFSFILVLPAALVLIAFPEIAVRLLFGENYLPAAGALQILAGNIIAYTLLNILISLIAGIGKPLANTKVVGAMACLNFFGNLLLIPPYGIEGAALTTLASTLAGVLLLLNYARKYVDFTVPASSLAKTLAGGLLTLLLILGLKIVIELPPWPEAFVIVISGLIFYGIWILVTKAVTSDDLKLIARIVPMPKWLVRVTGKFLRK
jgi:stage V sporulation protein B